MVDGGNGGSIEQGETGPLFTNGAPTGTNSWNAPGMFFTLNGDSLQVTGKTLTMYVVVDQAMKDSGGYMQLFVQQNGGSYGGTYCNLQWADMVVGQENELVCAFNTGITDGVPSIRLGFQLKDTTTFTGTAEVTYASWE